MQLRDQDGSLLAEDTGPITVTIRAPRVHQIVVVPRDRDVTRLREVALTELATPRPTEAGRLVESGYGN